MLRTRPPVDEQGEEVGRAYVAVAVEVRRAATGAIALTTNEWIKAQRFGEDYWLYNVDNCRDAPTLQLIQDPASKLAPKEEMSVVRYMVDQNDQKSASEEDVS